MPAMTIAFIISLLWIEFRYNGYLHENTAYGILIYSPISDVEMHDNVDVN